MVYGCFWLVDFLVLYGVCFVGNYLVQYFIAVFIPFIVSPYDFLPFACRFSYIVLLPRVP